MHTIRKTILFRLSQDCYGNLKIFSLSTPEYTDWIVGVEARDLINSIKLLNDTEFDEYCKSRMCSVFT